jgi:hypothetical protein
VEADQLEGDQLGGECLGSGNADLRPGPRVKNCVGLACQGRVDHVGNTDEKRTLSAGVTDRSERVERFPRLGDADYEGLAV